MQLARIRITRAALLPLLLSFALAACAGSGGEDKTGKGGGRGGRGGAGGTPEAGYVVVQPTTVPIVAELAGRTSPYQVSEVRPQVSGVIRARLFTEGSLVRAGQTLYQIDPSVYQAQAAQARANLASATANRNAARIRAGTRV
jgi:membrane fusion protein (multidrug efflux system)